MSSAEWNGCWKKRALSVRKICQHATILEGQSWALDCFCHCDVFSTINWLLLFLDMDFLQCLQSSRSQVGGSNLDLCVPATSTQAERVFRWMEWLLKKRALSVRKICQHATFLEGQSWGLDCFCHCDVFSTMNWLLSFLEMDFLGNWIHISHFWIYHLKKRK